MQTKTILMTFGFVIMSLPIFAAEDSLQKLPIESHLQVTVQRFEFSAPTQQHRIHIPSPMSENTCYTMRIYRVERIDKTDSTRPSGYSTCLAANKLQFKNATAEK